MARAALLHHIDENKLNEAAQHFMGAHDFTSFCTLDNRDMGDFTRTVTESSVTREGDMVRFTVAADGFLYNMVRIMTGTLLAVQQGRFAPRGHPEDHRGEKPASLRGRPPRRVVCI